MRCCASNEPARIIVRNSSMAPSDIDYLLYRRRYGAVCSSIMYRVHGYIRVHNQPHATCVVKFSAAPYKNILETGLACARRAIRTYILDSMPATSIMTPASITEVRPTIASSSQAISAPTAVLP